MSTLGFDNYVEPLKLYLQKYREGMKGENKVQWNLISMTMLGTEKLHNDPLQGDPVIQQIYLFF